MLTESDENMVILKSDGVTYNTIWSKSNSGKCISQKRQ